MTASSVDSPDVTIIIVAREGFAKSPDTLRNLIEKTTCQFSLVYVDGGSTPYISHRLRNIVRAHGGTFIRSRSFLRPTTARAIGFQEPTSKYAVFLDNDVWVNSGWLEPLVACAERSGAAYVSPVVTQRINGRLIIHTAGGLNEISGSGADSTFREHYAYMHTDYQESKAGLLRQQISMAEFHALLVRGDTLKKLGGLDQRCSTAFEHNDLCLSMSRIGAKGWLEPDSIVDYAPDTPAAFGNFSYCLVRWCRRWIDQSHQEFCLKWGIRMDDPALDPDLHSLHLRRRKPLRYVRGAIRRAMGNGALRRFDASCDWLVDRWSARYEGLPRVRIDRYVRS